MTDRKIIEECNRLAIRFYTEQGYVVSKEYKMYKTKHPIEIQSWNMAVIAFEELKGTDVEDALIEVRGW